MKKEITTVLFFAWIMVQGQTQSNYDLTAGNGNGFRFWNGSVNYKIHMGNTSEYKYGGVNDYSIKMNMNDNPDRGWVWGVNGQTPIASLNTQGDFHFQGELYANNGWLRVKGNRGIFFQDHGGGLFMLDDTWIRTYGNKSFYHNSGIMRTDGMFEVGSSGSRFRVLTNGRVGIGKSNPSTKFDVEGSVRSSDGNDNVTLRSDNTNSYSEISWGDDTNDRFRFFYNYWNGTASDKEVMTLLPNGNVGIGTATPDSKLTVKGNIHTQEVKVDLNGAIAPDYVFKEEYDLKSLEEVQNYIKAHGHLPNIPSAKEMEENGVLLKVMNLKLLEKIEELTLYTLEQEEKIQSYKKQLKLVGLVNKDQEERISKLEKLLIKK